MLGLRFVASLLCVFFIAQCSSSLAQSSPARPGCPWYTEGSAARALDGDVHVTVSLTDKSHGICTFLRLGPPRSELNIFVGEKDLPSCPKGSVAVVGIGTSAHQCSVNTAQRGSQQMISGTVREKAFAVVITTEGGPSGGISSSLTADTLKQVAEAVAGSLF